MTTLESTVEARPPVASAPTARWSWRYRGGAGRDERLDLLRGYALAAMSVNHLGLSQSWVHEASGRSSFLISAAEAFLFISGFTLGWVSAGRGPGEAEDRVWSRTWVLYLAMSGVSLAMMLVALHTDLALWAGFEAEEFAGPLDAVAAVATLRLAVGGVDILVAYIAYLLAAVVALRALERGRTGAVVATIAVFYGASQLASPGAFDLDIASFRSLVPNAPLLLGGLVLGFHREAVAAAWSRLRLGPLLDVALVVGAVALALLHARGWQDWPGLGDLVTAGNPEEPLWVREAELPVVPLLVVALYLRVGWLVADRLWEPLRRVIGPLVLPLRRAALFTFVAHLVAIPVFLNLPGFPEDDEPSRLAATGWVMAYLVAIVASVHVRDRVVAWSRSETPVRRWLRANGPFAAVAALTVAVLLSMAPSGQAGSWADADPDLDGDFELDDEHDDEPDDDGP